MSLAPLPRGSSFWDGWRDEGGHGEYRPTFSVQRTSTPGRRPTGPRPGSGRRASTSRSTTPTPGSTAIGRDDQELAGRGRTGSAGDVPERCSASRCPTRRAPAPCLQLTEIMTKVPGDGDPRNRPPWPAEACRSCDSSEGWLWCAWIGGSPSDDLGSSMSLYGYRSGCLGAAATAAVVNAVC
jgi:hypothetical protein